MTQKAPIYPNFRHIHHILIFSTNHRISFEEKTELMQLSNQKFRLYEFIFIFLAVTYYVVRRLFGFIELVQISASSYKWPKFTPISLQKCSCSAATIRFLRLIGANFSSFSPSNQNPEQALYHLSINNSPFYCPIFGVHFRQLIIKIMKSSLIKKIIVIHLLVICISKTYSQQTFKPVPDSLTSLYKYNLKKNFFQTEGDFNLFLNRFSSKVETFKEKLIKKATVQNLERLTQDLSQLEYDFRKMDLYLFLQYATNTTNAKASVLEDSIYDVMLTQRSKYRNHVKSTSQNTIKRLLSLSSMNSFQYYINNIITNKRHELSQSEIKLLKSFNYLKDNRFYDDLINGIPTDTIVTGTDTLDLFKNMGKWQNHPDSMIRAEGERKLYESYNTAKNSLGYQYIQMIKGLNAFSKSKNYETLIQENCDKISLSQVTLESTFQEIEANSSLFKNNSKDNIKEINRYSISTATDILLDCFKQLGPNYSEQAYQLLNPVNGRLDIVGGENRMGMQGVASVYPIDVSIFYANNYEGYYIDLMLLSHEAGHAIQASLMSDNKVSLLNGAQFKVSLSPHLTSIWVFHIFQDGIPLVTHVQHPQI